MEDVTYVIIFIIVIGSILNFLRKNMEFGKEDPAKMTLPGKKVISDPQPQPARQEPETFSQEKEGDWEKWFRDEQTEIKSQTERKSRGESNLGTEINRKTEINQGTTIINPGGTLNYRTKENNQAERNYRAEQKQTGWKKNGYASSKKEANKQKMSVSASHSRQPLQTEQASALRIRSRNEAKRAFIYSEIFNRKY